MFKSESCLSISLAKIRIRKALNTQILCSEQGCKFQEVKSGQNEKLGRD